MRDEQLNKWLSNGNTADDVFNLLKLNKKKASPVLSIWVSYMSKLKGGPDELLLLELKTRYSNGGLAKMLVEGKSDSSTSAIASRLEDLQLKNWLDKSKTADDVFNFLGLNKEGDKVFESPVLSTWISYLAKLIRIFQTKQYSRH